MLLNNLIVELDFSSSDRRFADNEVITVGLFMRSNETVFFKLLLVIQQFLCEPVKGICSQVGIVVNMQMAPLTVFSPDIVNRLRS